MNGYDICLQNVGKGLGWIFVPRKTTTWKQRGIDWNMDQILLFGNMIMLKAPYFSKLQNEHFLISSGLRLIKKDSTPG